MDCKIIRDLLPLYHDEVASIESIKLVEDHLETCPECKEILSSIKEDVKKKTMPNIEQAKVSGFRAVKKRLRLKSIITVVISVFCAIVVVSALTYGVFFYEMVVPYSEVEQKITQQFDSAPDFIANLYGYKSIYINIIEDTIYLSLMDSIWTRYFTRSNNFLSFYMSEAPVAPIAPIAPIAPAAPGSEIPELPSLPDAPEPPNPLNIISEATKIYYLDGNVSGFWRNDTSLSDAIANAILIWEK